MGQGPWDKRYISDALMAYSTPKWGSHKYVLSFHRDFLLPVKPATIVPKVTAAFGNFARFQADIPTILESLRVKPIATTAFNFGIGPLATAIRNNELVGPNKSWKWRFGLNPIPGGTIDPNIDYFFEAQLVMDLKQHNPKLAEKTAGEVSGDFLTALENLDWGDNTRGNQQIWKFLGELFQVSFPTHHSSARSTSHPKKKKK